MGLTRWIGGWRSGAVTAATGPPSGPCPRLQGRPSPASAAADDRARAVLALAPGGERAAALQALSPPQLIEVSEALAALAERWRLAGQNADALAAARLAVQCAERAVRRPSACAGAEPARYRHERARGLHRVDRRAAAQHRRSAVSTTTGHPCRSAGHAQLRVVHPRGHRRVAGGIDREPGASRRERGTPAEVAASLNFVAMAERQRGSYDSAVERYEEADRPGASSPAPTCSWRGR